MNCTPECEKPCSRPVPCGKSGLLIAVVLYILLVIILSSFTAC